MGLISASYSIYRFSWTRSNNNWVAYYLDSWNRNAVLQAPDEIEVIGKERSLVFEFQRHDQINGETVYLVENDYNYWIYFPWRS